jgi:hypothetical protein
MNKYFERLLRSFQLLLSNEVKFWIIFCYIWNFPYIFIQELIRKNNLVCILELIF